MTENHKEWSKVPEKEIEEGKICAVLMYIFWIVGIIWFFTDENMRKNRFAKFHVQQGIMLLIGSTILTFAIFLLIFIPIIGWILLFPAMILLWLPTVWMIIGIVYAVRGDFKPLPVIGEYALKWLKF